MGKAQKDETGVGQYATTVFSNTKPSLASTIIEEPTSFTVDGVDAIMVVTTETADGRPIARGYVVATPPGRDAAVFILEAPSAMWDDVHDALLATIEIN